jgi:hypothetical protein
MLAEYGLPIVAFCPAKEYRPFCGGKKSHSVGARWMFKRTSRPKEVSALKIDIIAP